MTDKSLKPKCGEIWMANLGLKENSIQNGYRPVLVISNNKNNFYSSVVTVIPITSKRKKYLPVHIKLERYAEYGLTKTSTILAEQMTAIPVVDLEKKIGQITDKETLSKVSDAIAIQIPIIGLLVSVAC
jgi:mRNA interferase MazF